MSFDQGGSPGRWLTCSIVEADRWASDASRATRPRTWIRRSGGTDGARGGQPRKGASDKWTSTSRRILASNDLVRGPHECLVHVAPAKCEFLGVVHELRVSSPEDAGLDDPE